MRAIYKLCTAREWREAEAAGEFVGSAVDRADGYIHFSEAGQLWETAKKHFAGQTDLVLVTIDADRLEPQPVWEPSRGGQLFPHLYGPLSVSAALSVEPMEIDADASSLARFRP